ILSGYFLGYAYGASASIIGVILAGISGYFISYYYGEKLEKLIIKDEKQRRESRQAFNQYGIFMILLSRAMPILPEVTACLSGITKMPFSRFILAWATSSVPYALIASYAGSISTLDNPKPAIITAIILSVFFWSGWFIFRKFQHKKTR
ncbi:MAG: VTT domain-containing protein, partial [Kangiellaceae bacterium]|nr:VTT domain-containing protein [Kangiellaceae bacterium]